MKARTVPVILLLFALPGCALTRGNQQDQVAALEATFTATITTLTDLRHDGKVSDADWKKSKDIAEMIDASFDVVHAELDAGKAANVDTILASIRAALARLSATKAEAQRR